MPPSRPGRSPADRDSGENVHGDRKVHSRPRTRTICGTSQELAGRPQSTPGLAEIMPDFDVRIPGPEFPGAICGERSHCLSRPDRHPAGRPEVVPWSGNGFCPVAPAATFGRERILIPPGLTGFAMGRGVFVVAAGPASHPRCCGRWLWAIAGRPANKGEMR